MKWIVALTLLVLSLGSAPAQPLTRGQARQYADALLEAGILSREGHQDLHKAIADEKPAIQAYYEEVSRFTLHVTGEAGAQPLHRSALLGFCAYIEHLRQSAPALVFDSLKRRDLVNRCKQLQGPGWTLGVMDTLEARQLAGERFPDFSPEVIGSLQRDYARLAEVLHRVDLLTGNAYADVQGWVREAQFSRERRFSFFQYAALRTGYYEAYPVRRQAQLAYLDTLRQTGVLPESSFRRLVAAYQPFELKSGVDILPHCNEALVLETTGLPDDPWDAFRTVLRAIAENLLPELTLDHLATFEETLRDEEYGGAYSKTVVAARLNGYDYQQTFWFDPYALQMHTAERFTLGSLHGREFQLVEDFLADREDARRLYLVEDKNGHALPTGSRLGLILLDSTQAEAFKRFDPHALTQPEGSLQQRNAFNRQGVRQVVTECQRIGLVPALPEAEINGIIVRARRDGYCSYDRVLGELPGVVADLDVHLPVEEALELPPGQVYRTVLEKLRKVSRGAFDPQKPFLEKIPGRQGEPVKFRFGFSCRNKSYSGILEAASQLRYSPSGNRVVEAINQALADQGTDGRYHSLRYGPHFLFLTKAQHEYLKIHHPQVFP
ncbi:MAG: hypothetical protein AVDCRST_MAG56-8028 [uncultured Cytophagales bacterium]|uniref:Uncharacterized protein n=1 Tax=uncultured Cytophagales bacterium TaxID=158755 RepID=A0A6J4LW49_9SPHI|nr:MAG: hypothetical protein AVDCRST_MAG56-8028 [uncultured Cytophagales bacterium]